MLIQVVAATRCTKYDVLVHRTLYSYVIVHSVHINQAERSLVELPPTSFTW